MVKVGAKRKAGNGGAVKLVHHCKRPLFRLYHTEYKAKQRGSVFKPCSGWMWCEKCHHPVEIRLGDPEGLK